MPINFLFYSRYRNQITSLKNQKQILVNKQINLSKLIAAKKINK